MHEPVRQDQRPDQNASCDHHDDSFEPAKYNGDDLMTSVRHLSVTGRDVGRIEAPPRHRVDEDWVVELNEQRPRLVPPGGGAHHTEDLVLRVRRLR